MADVLSALQLGVHYHRSGRLYDAEKLYREVLGSDPRNADAHHLLGMIALAEGETPRAIASIQTAIEYNPAVAEYHEHLGAAYTAAGQKPEALACYRQAVHLQPRSATAHNELGNALRDAGNLVEAEACYRTAIQLDPKLAEAHNNLGNALQDVNRLVEAAAAFQEALRLRPQSAEILFNLGNCYRAQKRFVEAAAEYRKAIAVRPDFPLAHHNLGTVLQSEKQFEAAIQSHGEALRLKPVYLEALNALGAAWQSKGDLETAKTYYRRALEMDPSEPTAKYNLATALQCEGRYDEAESLYKAVIDSVGRHRGSLMGLSIVCLRRGDIAAACDLCNQVLKDYPDDPEARFSLSQLQLQGGDFLAGWEGFEYRSRISQPSSRVFSQPLWDGADLNGRTLLVHAEYGFGDTLHFIRYMPRVRSRAAGSRVLVEVPATLIPLLAGSGQRDLVAHGSTLPPFDVQIPMMSLPRVFQTTVETIPAEVPYIYADSARAARWQSRLAEIAGFKVGIHWQGNTAYSVDRHRSIPLARFEPLARVPGVRLISLQKNAGADQVAQVAGNFDVISLHGLDEYGGAFMDTAAVIAHLDLVITSDSSIAHLAGSMGAPAWLALSSCAEWRWLLNRDDSPWYPEMRLFRQSRLDDWAEVFARMAGELALKVQETGHPVVPNKP